MKAQEEAFKQEFDSVEYSLKQANDIIELRERRI